MTSLCVAVCPDGQRCASGCAEVERMQRRMESPWVSAEEKSSLLGQVRDRWCGTEDKFCCGEGGGGGRGIEVDSKEDKTLMSRMGKCHFFLFLRH